MASSLAKIGPLFAVAGLTGYCLFPFLGPERIAREAAADRPAPIEQALLDPRLEPPLDRNPFEAALPASTAGATASGPATGKTRSAPRSGPPEPRLPDGLVLGATLVHGRRRAAVINGRIYSEGETLEVPGAGAGETGGPAGPRSLVLGRVEHDRVWFTVRWNDRDMPLALAYTERRTPTASLNPANPGAAPGGEPGSLEHLNSIAATAPYNALRSLSQRLLGRDVLPPLPEAARSLATLTGGSAGLVPAELIADESPSPSGARPRTRSRSARLRAQTSAGAAP